MSTKSQQTKLLFSSSTNACDGGKLDDAKESGEVEFIDSFVAV